MEEEKKEEEFIISEAKLRKLRNLKYFRDWTDEQIILSIKNKEKGKAPPNPADIIAEIPVGKDAPPTLDEEEYKKKFNTYLSKYRKEFGVDMNDANDAESLRSLVRYIIQQELVDKAIITEQMKPSPYPATLKGLGDFQRTLQQNINEVTTNLGISRKTRKEKQVDDIPQYIKMIQDKAAAFWERKTVPVRCEKCRIELARYWINFPDTVGKISFELECDKCKEKVIYAV